MNNGTHSILTIINFRADNIGVYRCQAIVDPTITSSNITDGTYKTLTCKCPDFSDIFYVQFWR